MDRKWWPEIAGAFVILVSRLLTMPRTFWELDEFLYASAVRKFEPLIHHPHQPGYPLYVGLAKVFAFLFGDPFRGMVALSVVSCVIGYIFLVRYAGAAAALIFYFSAGALVHLTLPLSDSAALMFLAIAWSAGFQPAGSPASSRRVVVFALACSAAIGTRPQLAIPLLPLFAFVLLRTRDWKKIALGLGAFTALSLAWFVPLVIATGGWTPFVEWELRQAAYVAGHDATASRGAAAMRSLIAWFVIHPFGPKWIAAPLLLLTAFGTFVMIRRRMFLPLAFGALHLTFAFVVMEPADSVRYSLPHVMVFCIAIGAALEILFAGASRRTPAGLPALHIAAACIIAAASVAYAWPLLRARTTSPSPPFAAAEYAKRTLARNTVIAYDLSLRPHAEYLLSGSPMMSIDRAMRELYDRPEVPVVMFVDGGSDAPDAKVFSWPHSDAYRILTRNLYEQVTLDPLRPQERYFPASGVYALERTAKGEEWRWLQADARIRLPRIHGPSVRLTFALPHDAPWPENRVHIVAGGVELAMVRVPRNGSASIGVTVDANDEIEVRAERSFMPAEVLRNQDRRTLAVQLLKLE